jgi:flagellar biosynthesis protein FlhB
MSINEVALKYQASLMSIPGVVGVSYGTDRIIVYVKTEADASGIPMVLDGVPVQVVVAGEIKPLW